MEFRVFAHTKRTMELFKKGRKKGLQKSKSLRNKLNQAEQ